MTTGRGTRPTLILGAALGVIGTLAFALTASVGSTLLAMAAGIVVSGVGQGMVWTAMWVAVGTGTPDYEQGTASGIGATAQNTGNAIGLAVFVAIGSGFAAGATEQARLASSAQAALVAISAAIVAVAIAAALLKDRKKAPVAELPVAMGE